MSAPAYPRTNRASRIRGLPGWAFVGLALLLCGPFADRALGDSAALMQIVRASDPIRSREALRPRLGLSPERARAIVVGPRGKRRVMRFLAADTGSAGYTCTSHGCSCHGDDDCNLMYEQACADPATNGACTGDVCTCTP